MVEFKVNSRSVRFDGDPNMPLLWFLRDEAGMTGTKYGCGIALCGACTVHVDGRPVRSCQMPVGALAGRHVTTIEGVAEQRIGRIVQAAWVALQVPQCGYCQSGQVMSAVALLKAKRNPTDEDIDAAMSGNVCRCATYERIRTAIHKASKELGA